MTWVQTSKNSAHGLKARNYALNCTNGRLDVCAYLHNTFCSFGRVVSDNPWCEFNCDCEFILGCNFYNGCKVAQPGAEAAEAEGEDGKVTEMAPSLV